MVKYNSNCTLSEAIIIACYYYDNDIAMQMISGVMIEC